MAISVPSRDYLLKQQADYVAQKAQNLEQIDALTESNTLIDLQQTAITDAITAIDAVFALVAPVGFAATSPVATEASLAWTNDPDVDVYKIELAELADYSDAHEIYSGALTSPQVVAGLVTGVTYYFRIKGTAADKDDSPWSNDSVVVS